MFSGRSKWEIKHPLAPFDSGISKYEIFVGRRRLVSLVPLKPVVGFLIDLVVLKSHADVPSLPLVFKLKIKNELS